MFFGSGDNKLVGSDDLTGIIDFETLIATSTGIFTITDGEGELEGAQGILSFSEVDQLKFRSKYSLYRCSYSKRYF